MPRTGKRFQRHYDHRLRELVFRTGDVTVATELGVPRSTAAGWVRGDLGRVVSLDVHDLSTVELEAELVKLRRHVETLRAELRLLVGLQKIAAAQIERTRISDAPSRARLLRAAERLSDSNAVFACPISIIGAWRL
jgi:transposase-like protein